MNKRKLILPVVLTFCVVMIFMLLGGTVSYLTDAESGVNVITIGNVGLVLTEPKYKDNSVLSAGDSPEKNPMLINSGTKDEFVFIEVAVPKRNVTLLYEESTIINGNLHKEGTPTVNNYDDESSIIQKNDEIYKIIADGATAVNLTANGELTDNEDPKTQPQLDFSYNKGDSDNEDESKRTAGWIYLNRKIPTGENAEKYDYYYFGYNRKLSKENSTIPLFDRVQLKSFIDEELNSAEPVDGVKPKKNEQTKIIIKGYGIQADSLGIPGLDTDAFLTRETLNKIFNIVKEKKG